MAPIDGTNIDGGYQSNIDILRSEIAAAEERKRKAQAQMITNNPKDEYGFGKLVSDAVRVALPALIGYKVGGGWSGAKAGAEGGIASINAEEKRRAVRDAEADALLKIEAESADAELSRKTRMSDALLMQGIKDESQQNAYAPGGYRYEFEQTKLGNQKDLARYKEGLGGGDSLDPTLAAVLRQRLNLPETEKPLSKADANLAININRLNNYDEEKTGREKQREQILAQSEIPGYSYKGKARATPGEAAKLRTQLAAATSVVNSLDTIKRVVQEKGAANIIGADAQLLEAVSGEIFNAYRVMTGSGARLEGPEAKFLSAFVPATLAGKGPTAFAESLALQKDPVEVIDSLKNFITKARDLKLKSAYGLEPDISPSMSNQKEIIGASSGPMTAEEREARIRARAEEIKLQLRGSR